MSSHIVVVDDADAPGGGPCGDGADAEAPRSWSDLADAADAAARAEARQLLRGSAVLSRSGTPELFAAQRLTLPPALRCAYVTVDGPVGCGKTTLARLLRRKLGADAIMCLYETRHQRMLPLFVADPPTHAAVFQAHMYAHNVECRRFGPWIAEATRRLVVQDRSMAGNMVFYESNVESGNFTDAQRQMYETSVVRPYWRRASGAVFLYNPAHTTMVRLQRRDDASERKYSLRYIESLLRYNYWMLMHNATRRRPHPILCVLWAADYMDVQPHVLDPLAALLDGRRAPLRVHLHSDAGAPDASAAAPAGDVATFGYATLRALCVLVMRSCPGACHWVDALAAEADGGGGDASGDGGASIDGALDLLEASRQAAALGAAAAVVGVVHVDFEHAAAFDDAVVVNTLLFLMTRPGLEHLHVHRTLPPRQRVPALFNCFDDNADSDVSDDGDGALSDDSGGGSGGGDSDGNKP
jgi:deoxyadenosine/deoxycytidine kinase